jgi:hypothetical protein
VVRAPSRRTRRLLDMGAVEGGAAGTLRLRDVVERINDFDDELTIYAAPDWTPESAAVVAREPDAGGVPPEAAAAGMRYFLEVFLVKEVLDGLKQLDLDGKTTRLIRYAVTDA